MNRGFFPVFRKIFDSDLWRNHKASRLFIFILGHITHVPTKTCARYQCIELEPGQMLAGRRQLAAGCGFTEQETRTALTYLISTNRITSKATNRYSLITVINWPTYKEWLSKFNQLYNRRGNQQTTSRQPADNHIKEVKKLKDTTGANGVRPLFELYTRLFTEKVGDQPTINFAKDGALLKGLLKIYGEDRVRNLLAAFFTSPDPFIVKSGYTIGVFHSQVNKLLVDTAQGVDGAQYMGTAGRRLESLV